MMGVIRVMVVYSYLLASFGLALEIILKKGSEKVKGGTKAFRVNLINTINEKWKRDEVVFQFLWMLEDAVISSSAIVWANTNDLEIYITVQLKNVVSLIEMYS